VPMDLPRVKRPVLNEWEDGLARKPVWTQESVITSPSAGRHNTLLHETHHYTAQGLDCFASKTSMLDVFMHVTIPNINRGISMNFNQEYVSITSSTAQTFLYL
jgi:hypothetical protein